MTHDASGPDAAQLPSPIDGRYRVLSRLGSGGMADVYLAEDETLGRKVAVKVLKAEMASDAEFVERFRIEAQAAARLNHPAIVAVYDRGGAGERPYIAMEYVDGESLKQRLRRDGRLPAGEALETILAVLDALQVAHEHDIVHRDITSSNVLLATNGGVKVADFGIARIGSSALTRSGVMMGTSSYLSPEQAQGRPADERSDVYSAGVVLFEMLTGKLPFRGDSDIAVAMQHVSAAPPNPRSLAPDVPEVTAAAVMKALSKDPADRFQSAAEFAAALRGAPAAAPAAAAASGASAAGAAAAGAAAVGAAHTPPAPQGTRPPPRRMPLPGRARAPRSARRRCWTRLLRPSWRARRSRRPRRHASPGRASRRPSRATRRLSAAVEDGRGSWRSSCSLPPAAPGRSTPMPSTPARACRTWSATRSLTRCRPCATKA